MNSPENVITKKQQNYSNISNQPNNSENIVENGPSQIDEIYKKLEKLDISFRKRFAALCLEKIKSNMEEKYLQYCAFQINKMRYYIENKRNGIENDVFCVNFILF